MPHTGISVVHQVSSSSLYWSVFVLIKTDTVVITKLNKQNDRKMKSIVDTVSLVNVKYLKIHSSPR